MERAEVVVRQPNRNTEPARVGAVLSVDGTRCLVRWEDNGEEEVVVAAGSIRRARRGSLRHQALVDPAPIADWFAQDPKGIILRVLREQGSSMTPQRIREELEQLGLDPAVVKKAWATASKALSKNDVEVAGKGRAAKFRWIGPDDQSADAAAAPVPDPSPVSDPLPVPAPEPRRPATDGLVVQVVSVAERHAAADDVRTEEPVASEKVTPPAAQPSLAARIVEVTGDLQPAGLQDYLSRPLAVGARFGQFESQQLDAFLTALPDEDRQVAENLLLALPRQSAAIDGARRRTPLDGSVVARVLDVAAAELRAYAEPEPAVVTAAAWLLRRAAALADLPATAVAPMMALLVRLAAARRDQDLAVLDAAASALARLLPGLPRDQRAGLDLDGLPQAVSHMPLQPEGGRAALLAAIGKFRSKSLLLPEWWEGVTVDALAECATGVLGGVTSRSEVVEQYIKPLVARELSQVTSRTRLGFLLGLPGEFVADLSPEAVVAAFRRVAGADQVVASWVGALAQEQRVEALRRDVERAHGEIASAERRVEAAERRAAGLAERCDRLEESLRAEHRQAASLRSAQDRQIQIDVIRSLADLAAEVEELSVEQTESEILVERVRALVTAQALEPVGLAGEKLAFDPTAHEPIVGAPASGDAVTVIRPGYRWCPPGEDILIEKALVTTT
ncbi:hypothetical protein ACGFJ5_04825 [Micromonospora echinaurantiaca]|uniref:hypothetical protein n=1 Tax=Micromonospora echinaurantiaca TaxID=47857 RepID=UPI00371AC458